MHYRFEIPLIVNSILEEAADSLDSNFAREVMQQHLQRYVTNFYREHAVLPTGRHYLGMTRPLNLEVGMIDFDAIRRQLRSAPVSNQAAESHTPAKVCALPKELPRSSL